MKTLLLALMVVSVCTCLAHFASAHTVNPLSIQYDTNHTQPPTQPILTKYGELLFVISKPSTFTIPLIIGHDYFTTTAPLSLHVTFSTDMPESMPKGFAASLVPDHLILNGSREHKVNFVVRVSKDAPDGLYKPSIETGFGGWRDIALLVEDNSTQVPSPLKQFKSGVLPYQIRCGYPMVLFFRSSDHYPVCLTVATEEKSGNENGLTWAPVPIQTDHPSQSRQAQLAPRICKASMRLQVPWDLPSALR